MKFSLLAYFITFNLFFYSLSIANTIDTNNSNNFNSSAALSDDGQKLADRIAQLSALAIYNVNQTQLENLVTSILTDNQFIKALNIIDNIDDESLVTFFRDNEKMVFNQKIPDELKKLNRYKASVKYEDEVIGQVIIFYSSVQQTRSVHLTDEEKLWIKTHPIKVGIEPWAPIVFFKNGQAQGLAVDYLNYIIKKTGLNVEFISAPWNQLFELFKAGKLDILPSAYHTQAREKYGYFSKPFYTVRQNIYVKNNNHSIQSLADLSGKKMALEKGYATIEQLRHSNPEITIIETNNFKETIEYVLNQKASAFIEPGINAQTFFKKHAITGLKGIYDLSLPANKLHFYSSKKIPLLAAIIQKGLNSITPKEHHKIVGKWVDSDYQVVLSEQEQNWIDKQIPVRYVYNIDWAPFERLNEIGQHTGFIADILHLIQAKTGLNFTPIHTQSWKEAVAKAKDRTADMYSGVGKTKDRKTYMNFSRKPIFSTDYVFISRQNENYLSGFDDLKNKKVAVVKNSTIHAILKEKRPEQSLTLIDSVKSGLDKLLNHEIDVMIANATTAKYSLHSESYNSLKMAFKTKFKLDIHIGIRNDWPKEVISIIDKAMMEISDEEISEIFLKWTDLKVTERINYSLLIKVVIAFTILILVFIVWNRKQAAINKQQTKLINDVLEMKEQLTSEVADRKQSEALAEHAKERLENITNNIPGVVYQFEISHGNIIVKFISDGIKSLHYIEPETIIKDASLFIKSIHPQDQELVLSKLLQATDGQSSNLKCEYRVILQNEFLANGSIHDNNTFKDNSTCKDKACIEQTCSQNECLEAQSERVRWISLNATISVIDGGDNDILFFDDDISSKDIQLNGNLVEVTEAKLAHAQLLEQQKEITQIHKHTRESIEYAALIQNALIPENKVLQSFFKDSFAIWHPKDLVGGDIYLMEAINDNELILMLIDCTGHGVPGAFVTMLVKAIERQVMEKVKEEQHISPAKILSIFNRSIKRLLKQEDVNSISNAGFDGGILYFNKQEKIIRFAGAECPLFIIQSNELKMIKGNRHSIGYKKSDMDYQFTDHTIDISIPTKFYLTTDGFIDQNGGAKGFCFGTKRFKKLILDNANYSFADQQEIFLNALHEYQESEERNDDVTVLGGSIDIDPAPI